ncbi:adenylate kinase [bacterium]|nr:adenylate kinase [bacterium]|tara:strand:+ start:97 stop:642 length:546 start_codon:yes stop_codon:yes gene_type:complete
MIILLGPPGSGKGTQAEKVAEYFNISAICMGDIVRNQIRKSTKLGKEMKSYLDKGDLVPDSVINAMYDENKPKLCAVYGALLDGYPRTINQAKYLTNLYKNTTINTIVISLDVLDDVLIERLLERKRSDDTIDVIKNRLINYQREIDPLLKYYQNSVIHINGMGKIDDVFVRICNAIKNNT